MTTSMIRTLFVLPLMLIAIARADEANILGERVTGFFDVSFRPFAGAQKVEQLGVGELMKFARPESKWTLAFDRAELPSATSIKDVVDSTGKVQPGYLTAAVSTLKLNDPSFSLIRQELFDLGKFRVGLIVASIGQSDRELMQQAIIEVTPTLYYSLVMRSPVTREKLEEDPNVRDAATAFKGIIDSIERVDLAKVRWDQEERLRRTRALLLTWNQKKLKSVLHTEQMLRIVRGGEDFGYAYVVEQPASALPREGANPNIDPDKAAGLRVGLRMRTFPEPGKPADMESWSFVTFDRKNEAWWSASFFPNPNATSEKDARNWFTEVGSVRETFRRGLRPEDFKEAEKGDKGNVTDVLTLNVRVEGRSTALPPIKQDVPPFYIPQALASLLPRLLPLDQPAGYLFASYASDTRKVMLRYVDVGAEKEVTLGGKRMRAVPVQDRIGMDGIPVTHYVSHNGEFLGSVNPQTKTEIIPATREEVVKIWKDANLTQPGEVKETVQP